MLKIRELAFMIFWQTSYITQMFGYFHLQTMHNNSDFIFFSSAFVPRFNFKKHCVTLAQGSSAPLVCFAIHVWHSFNIIIII